MMTYTLRSTKGRRTVTGTLTDAVLAAWEMDDELQPAGGITIMDAHDRILGDAGDRDEDITQLRSSARVAADEMVAICQRALTGDDEAVRQCALAIGEALGQVDE